MNKFKNIQGLILNIIIFVLVIIAILVVYSFVQLNVLNREYTNVFGYSLFKTETGSMADTIEIGDIVIVKLGNAVKENDIITFKQDGNIITHRVIKMTENEIITKGDNNNSEDKPISESDIIGKVIFIINDVRVWQMVFADSQVIIPVIITVFLFVVLVLYKENSKEDNADEEKND